MSNLAGREKVRSTVFSPRRYRADPPCQRDLLRGAGCATRWPCLALATRLLGSLTCGLVCPLSSSHNLFTISHVPLHVQDSGARYPEPVRPAFLVIAGFDVRVRWRYEKRTGNEKGPTPSTPSSFTIFLTHSTRVEKTWLGAYVRRAHILRNDAGLIKRLSRHTCQIPRPRKSHD